MNIIQKKLINIDHQRFLSLFSILKQQMRKIKRSTKVKPSDESEEVEEIDIEKPKAQIKDKIPSPKEDPISSSKSSKKKNVSEQTVYYNIRKQQYENPERKRKYFKEDQSSILDSHDIQQKLFTYNSVEQILRLYNGHKFTFSTKNLITAIQKLGKILPIERKAHSKSKPHGKKTAFKYKINEKRIQSLLFILEENMNVFAIQEKVTILWALTKMRFFETELYLKLTEDLFQNIKDLSIDDIALLVWCISKTATRNPKLYGMAAIEIEKKLKISQLLEKKPSVSANSAKDESEDDIDDVDIVEEETGSLKKRSKDLYSARSIALLFWSFSKRNIEDRDLFNAFYKIFFSKTEYFGLHEACLMLYAMIHTGTKILKNDMELLQKSLSSLNLEQEKSLTLKTMIVLLDQAEVKTPELYKKLLDAFFLQNPKLISPRFACELFKVISKQNLLEEKYLQIITTSIQRNISKFNLIDCLSAFESCLKCRKSLGAEGEKIIDIIIARLSFFEADLKSNQIKLLMKLSKETNYHNKRLDKILIKFQHKE